jgi:periplasmic divalent cation tolerance protein
LHGPILVFTTLPDRTAAEALADHLVTEGLAACVHIGAPVTSVYRWEGSVQHDTEVPVAIKTRAERYNELQDAIVAAHPYELPELIAVPITCGLPDYLTWIETCTSD